jgi:hypothetical protein
MLRNAIENELASANPSSIAIFSREKLWSASSVFARSVAEHGNAAAGRRMIP